MTSTSRLQFVLRPYLQKSITNTSIYSKQRMMIVRRQKQTYSTANPSSDNVLQIRKCSGVKPIKVYQLQNHSTFQGKFKTKHRSFLLLRWRTRGRDKLVQVNSISNPSGSSNEGLHERFEVMLLGIGHPDGRQLVLSRILAMNTDQR